MKSDVFDDGIWLIRNGGMTNVGRGEECNVIVVIRSGVVVWSTREGVRANHGGTWFVNEVEIEFGKFERPTGLSTVEFLVFHEVLQVFVV